MKRTHTLTLLSVVAATSAFAQVAQAATPANVTGITAAIEGGKLVVQWQAPQDASSVSFYRIYFSSESILENAGDYDDFERTLGSETSYAFYSIPLASERIYLSVFAVNQEGTESAGFEEEASVIVPQAASSSVATSSEPSTPQIPLALERVFTLSSTGVILEFSAAILTPQEITADTFAIVDASGSELLVRGYEIRERQITLITAVQQGGRIYAIGLLKPILPMDPSLLPSLPAQGSFTGMAAAFTSSQYVRNPNLPQSSAPRDSTPPDDPENLRLSARVSGKLYDVQARWEDSPNTAGDLMSYGVYGNHDEQDPSSLKVRSDQTSALFPSIAPGVFNVRITSVDRAGNESEGIARAINLPASGLGLAGIFMVTGAIAGRRIKKRNG